MKILEKLIGWTAITVICVFFMKGCTECLIRDKELQIKEVELKFKNKN